MGKLLDVFGKKKKAVFTQKRDCRLISDGRDTGE
jgi:hypothetical protein